MDSFGNLINGEWLKPANANPNVNPSNVADIIGEYARGDESDVANAVEAAQKAVPVWSGMTGEQRGDILDKIGDEILARKDELGKLLSREEGKTLVEGIGETVRAGRVFKFFAGEALRMGGEFFPSVRPGVSVEISREPLGVVGIITPWNFPIAIPAWKIAPALAYGNCVVFKPADLVPGCAWALTDIIHRCGVPAGAFNLVMGRGSSVGEAILTNKGIAGVSFTGSVEVGHHVAEACVARMAKVQLEMGGKNPMVVLDDADLKTAVGCSVNGAYFSTGQRCTASSRLIVEQGIHDKFVDALKERLASLTIGDALDPDTYIGPAVDATQLAQDMDYIDIGRNEGAELVYGGQRLNRSTEGFYLEPALFIGTSNDMRINQEEIFGPVASVIKVKDYDEALSTANDTTFGLSSGICTSSLKYAADFRKNSQAGMAMVNLPTAGVDYHVPFGGRKGSSYGAREQGHYAIEFYTSVKTSYIAP
jgi:aldehyde dehydrogenase (NAD+)